MFAAIQMQVHEKNSQISKGVYVIEILLEKRILRY